MKYKLILFLVAVLILGTWFWWLRYDDQENDNLVVTISPTVLASKTPQASETLVIIDAPFTSQAPDGNWSNPLFQDGCEEASVIMAMHWAKRQALNIAQAKEEILALSDFQKREYGSAVDRSAKDTAQMIRDYYNFNNIQYLENIDAKDIKDALYDGKVVIVPMDGRKLGNPNYTAPGPERHMLVVVGYDPIRKEFITNDPGTRRGRQYRYGEATFIASIRDYPTGDHEPITSIKKNMITVSAR